MQIYEPIWRPSKPGPFLAGLYLNSQSIMLMKNAFIMTNQGHIAYRRAETSSGEDGICIKQQSMQQWMLLPYYYTHIHNRSCLFHSGSKFPCGSAVQQNHYKMSTSSLLYVLLSKFTRLG